MQWHQLDHMQTICTNTSSLSFYRPGALPDAQPTVSKHDKLLKRNSFVAIAITFLKLQCFYAVASYNSDQSVHGCADVVRLSVNVYSWC